MGETFTFVCYVLLPALLFGFLFFGFLCVVAPSQVHLEQSERLAAAEKATSARERQLQEDLDKARRELDEQKAQALKPYRPPPEERPTARELAALADRPATSAASGDERRLEIARSKINEHAKRGRDVVTGDQMNTWMEVGADLLQGTVKTTICHKFHRRISSSRDKPIPVSDRKYLELAINALEVIQVNLAVDQLLKPPMMR
jgi:hypothetical protein